MKNLEQIRAYNAITAQGRWAGVNDGEVVKKIPAMIRENGLLGAAAFAVDKTGKEKERKRNEPPGIPAKWFDGKSGQEEVFDAIIDHLIKVEAWKNKKDFEDVYLKENDGYKKAKRYILVFIEELAASESNTLRRVTSESLAFLNYLRRFAKKSGGDEGGE